MRTKYLDKSVRKYLESYAENESKLINNYHRIYDEVIVIPICNEPIDCIENIFRNCETEQVLIILVVNSPIGHTNWQLSNNEFIDQLQHSSTDTSCVNENMYSFKYKNVYNILLVNRNSNNLQLDKKHGVGLARKIGADIALKLYALGIVKSSWIYTTDADVYLPNCYFKEPVKNSRNFSAVVLGFEHISDDEELKTIQFYYDFKLYYYQAGLKYAQNTYEYIPLGSTLIIDAKCYSQVRGFPKRNAGEDFYILNKLAKVLPVYTNANLPVVKIKSRISNRVPFGTGPALEYIKSLNNMSLYTYYHPKCFLILKQWQLFLHNMWQHNRLEITHPKCKRLNQLYEYFNCKTVFIKCRKQITSNQKWTQFIHQWFDSFKTLKAIHYWNKIYLPINYQELLISPSFAKVCHPKLRKFIINNDKA